MLYKLSSSSNFLLVLLIVVILTIISSSSSNYFVQAISYIDCTSVSCTPYTHGVIPIYDEVRVINAPVGASFNFNNAFMNALAFDTNLDTATVNINTATMLDGNLEFRQPPVNSIIDINLLTTLKGSISFTSSIGAGTSLSIRNSKLTLVTSSFLVQPHGIFIADETSALTAVVGTINIAANTIYVKHESPASTFSVSGVWIGKLTRAPTTLIVSSNTITVDNTKAYGIYLSPTLAWQTNSPSVSINANTIQAVHVKVGSGVTFGTSYGFDFTLLSIQTNIINQNASNSVVSNPDVDGDRFSGVEFVFCYVRQATAITISSNQMFLSDGDYTNGIRLVHSGDCGTFTVPARRLDSVASLTLSSNKIEINATQRAVAIQLGAQRTVTSRLALGSNTGATGIPSGRNVNLQSNTIVAKSHHVRGIDIWLWNVAGVDTFAVSSNNVVLTQEKSTDKTEDGSDVIASAYGVHVAFNDRFSNVFISSLSLMSNTISISSGSQNSECASRLFWYDYCWAEFAGVWVRWHASRAGGYSPRGSTVNLQTIDLSSNVVAFYEAGSVFLHGVVFDHVSMKDVTADDANAVTYTPGLTITVSTNNVLVSTFSATTAANSINSTLQNGIGFSSPIATFTGTQTLSDNTITISATSMNIILLSGAFKASSSCFSSGNIVVSKNTLSSSTLLSAARGTGCGILVSRAGDGATLTSGNTTISENSITVSDTTNVKTNYFVGIAFVWSKTNIPSILPQNGGTAPTLGGTAVAGVNSYSTLSILSNTIVFSSSNVSAVFAAFTTRMDALTSFSLLQLQIDQNIITSLSSYSELSESGILPPPLSSIQAQQTFLAASCKPFFVNLRAASTVTVATVIITMNSISITTAPINPLLLALDPVFYVKIFHNITKLQLTANSIHHTHNGVSYDPSLLSSTSASSSVFVEVSSVTTLNLPTIEVTNNTFVGTFSAAASTAITTTAPTSLLRLNGVRISCPVTNVTFSENNIEYTTSSLLVPVASRPVVFSSLHIRASGNLLSTSKNRIFATGSTTRQYSAGFVGMNLVLEANHQSTSVADQILSYSSLDDRIDVRGSGSVISALNVSSSSTALANSNFFDITLSNISAGAHARTASEVESLGDSVVSTVIFPSYNLSASKILCDRCYFWSGPNKIFTSPYSYFNLGWFVQSYKTNTSVVNSPSFFSHKTYDSLIPFYHQNTTYDSQTNITFYMSKFNAFCIEYNDAFRAFNGILENGGSASTVNVTSACSGTRSKSMTFTESATSTDRETRTHTTFSRTPPPTRTATNTSRGDSRSESMTDTYYPGIITEPYPITAEGVFVASALLAGFTAPAALLQIGALVSLMDCGQAQNAAMRIAITPVYAELFDGKTPSYFWLGQAFLVGGFMFLHFLAWLVVLLCGQLCQPEAISQSYDHASREAREAKENDNNNNNEEKYKENRYQNDDDDELEQQQKSCCCPGCIFCTTRSRLSAMRVRFPHWTMWAMNWLLFGWVYESGLYLFNTYPNEQDQYLKLGLALIAPIFAIIQVILVFFFSWRAKRAHENGDMWCVYGQRRKALQTEEEKLDGVLQTEMTRNMAIESRRVSPRSVAVATRGSNAATMMSSTPRSGGGLASLSRQSSVARSATNVSNHIIHHHHHRPSSQDSMAPNRIRGNGTQTPLALATNPRSSAPGTPLALSRSPSHDRNTNNIVDSQGLVRTPVNTNNMNTRGRSPSSASSNRSSNNNTPLANEIYNTPARFSAHYNGGTNNNNNNNRNPINSSTPRSLSVQQMTPRALNNNNNDPRDDIHAPNLPSPGRNRNTNSGPRRRLRETRGGTGAGGCCGCCGDDEDHPRDYSLAYYDGSGGTVCCSMNGSCWKAVLPIGYWATHFVVSAERAHNQQYGVCYYEYLPSVLPWIPFFESCIRLLVFPLIAAIKGNCSVVRYLLTIIAFFAFAGCTIIRPNRAGIIDFFHSVIWFVLALLTLTTSFESVSQAISYIDLFYVLCGFCGVGILVYLLILLLELGVWRPEWEKENQIDEEIVIALDSMDEELSRDITIASGIPLELQQQEEEELRRLEEEQRQLEDEEMREKLASVENNRLMRGLGGGNNNNRDGDDDVNSILGRLSSARSNSSLKNIKRNLVGGFGGVTARGANGEEETNSSAPSSIPNTGRGTISGDQHKELSGMRKEIDGAWGTGPDGKTMRYNWWEKRDGATPTKSGSNENQQPTLPLSTPGKRQQYGDVYVEDLNDEENDLSSTNIVDLSSPYSNSQARRRDEEIMRMKAGGVGRFAPGSLHPSRNNSGRGLIKDPEEYLKSRGLLNADSSDLADNNNNNNNNNDQQSMRPNDLSSQQSGTGIYSNMYRHNSNNNNADDNHTNNNSNSNSNSSTQLVARLDGGYIGKDNFTSSSAAANNNNNDNNSRSSPPIDHTLRGGEIRARANINNPNENVRKKDQLDFLIARVGEQVHQSRYERMKRIGSHDPERDGTPERTSPEAQRLAVEMRGGKQLNEMMNDSPYTKNINNGSNKNSPQIRDDLPRQLNTGMAEFVDDPKNPKFFDRERIRAPYDNPEMDRNRNIARSQTNYASPNKVDASSAFGRRGQQTPLHAATPRSFVGGGGAVNNNTDDDFNNNNNNSTVVGVSPSVFGVNNNNSNNNNNNNGIISAGRRKSSSSYNPVNNSGRDVVDDSDQLDSARRQRMMMNGGGETRTFNIPTSSSGRNTNNNNIHTPIRRPTTTAMNDDNNNQQDPHDRTNYDANITPDTLMRESRRAGNADVLTLPSAR